MGLTNYWNELTSFSTTFDQSYPGYNEGIGIKKVTSLEQIRTLWNPTNILSIFAILLGVPWLIIRVITKKDIASQFLLSNIFLYLIVKSPLVYNALLENKMRIIAERLDGMLLFFIITAFIIVFFVKRLKLKENYLKYIIWLSTVIIFVLFGTDNSFAEELRYRKNAGYNYLKMTEYFKSLEKPVNDVGGFTVLTDIKTAYDVYAFFNAYVFQYRKELWLPLAISLGRKDLERLIFYPEEGDKLFDLIENNRVDYIIVPTEKTLYVSIENAVNFDRAINFYNSLEAYKLIYLDEYYYVYKKTGFLN